MFGDEERKEVNEVLETGVLMRYGFDAARKGRWKAKELEQEINKKFGSKHAQLVCNGTAALTPWIIPNAASESPISRFAVSAAMPKLSIIVNPEQIDSAMISKGSIERVIDGAGALVTSRWLVATVAFTAGKPFLDSGYS